MHLFRCDEAHGVSLWPGGKGVVIAGSIEKSPQCPHRGQIHNGDPIDLPLLRFSVRGPHVKLELGAARTPSPWVAGQSEYSFYVLKRFDQTHNRTGGATFGAAVSSYEDANAGGWSARSRGLTRQFMN